MNKITVSVEYIVFESGVKAIVKLNSVPNCISEMIDVSYTLRFPLKITDNFPKTAMGIARIKSGDKFDVELGKKIARKKAMRKLYGELYNFENAFMNEFNKKAKEFHKHMCTLDYSKYSISKEIERLANS